MSASFLPASLQQLLREAHTKKKVVVLATGVFDILHQEHQIFLRKAKQLGDVLVVGLESDVRVRQMKGEGRPIHPQIERQKNLEQLHIANAVFILPEHFSSAADHEQLIAAILPQFLAISSHTSHQVEKKAIVEKFGGQLRIVHQHNPAVSTTQILAQQKRLQEKGRADEL